MSEPTQSVRQFIAQSYQLISPDSPTVPLHGDDLNVGVLTLNRLMDQYSATGLMITVSQQVDFTIDIGVGTVIFAPPDFIPPIGNTFPIITTQNRLANLLTAWVTLDGITYPLIDESRTEFQSSYKYDPLLGLPRYIIVTPQVNYTLVRVYPGPSQLYALSVYAKFQLANLTSNSDMSELPTYYYLYLQFALAKYLSFYKARSEAWTEKLEDQYIELKNDMVASSSTNLDINVNNESWLNGAWRVRSGI